MGGTGSKPVETPQAKTTARPIKGASSGGNDKTLRTISSHQKQIDMLEKKGEFLSSKAEKEKQRAFELQKKGDKTGAKACVDRYNKIMKQRDVCEGAKAKLEEQVFALQNAQSNIEVVQALATGNETLRTERERNGMDADTVSEIMDNMRNEIDEQQNVNDLLAEPTGTEVSEDDLADFFAEHANDSNVGVAPAATVFTKVTPGANANPNYDKSKTLPMAPLPSAPTSAVQMSDEDKEMAALAAQMGM